MFQTTLYKGCFIHARIEGGTESYQVQASDYSIIGDYSSYRAAQLAITRHCKDAIATAKRMAAEYRQRFGFRLYTRLMVLSHRYPNVKEPDSIAWEGAILTGADTTVKIRALLKVCPQSES